MFKKLELTAMAQAMAAQAGARMGVIARNIAHADTPGYKAADLPAFADTYRGLAAGGLRQTRPGHLAGFGMQAASLPRPSPGTAAPNGNTVSLEAEMVKAAQARQDHEMALAIYRGTSAVVRASLGRK